MTPRQSALISTYAGLLREFYSWAQHGKTLDAYLARVAAALEGRESDWQATGYSLEQACKLHRIAPPITLGKLKGL